MAAKEYHRRTTAFPDEKEMVRNSGFLWGKSPRMSAGDGPECVKAFVGPLPAGETGYTFETEIEPTRPRNFAGIPGAVWVDGTEGVTDVPDWPGYVRIPVRIADG